MKKQSLKKLTLDRESVRNLTRGDLEEARGAGRTQVPSICPCVTRGDSC